MRRLRLLFLKAELPAEKQIPCGNDRQKSKGENRVGFFGFPPLPQGARQGWGTLIGGWGRESKGMVRRLRVLFLKAELPAEKQIPCGSDRQKSKGENRVGFCGFPPLPQGARQGWGTLISGWGRAQ